MILNKIIDIFSVYLVVFAGDFFCVQPLTGDFEIDTFKNMSALYNAIILLITHTLQDAVLQSSHHLIHAFHSCKSDAREKIPGWNWLGWINSWRWSLLWRCFVEQSFEQIFQQILEQILEQIPQQIPQQIVSILFSTSSYLAVLYIETFEIFYQWTPTYTFVPNRLYCITNKITIIYQMTLCLQFSPLLVLVIYQALPISSGKKTRFDLKASILI